MRAAALQFDVRRGRAADNLAAAEAGLREAARAGVALVCLPEMWATSFPGPETDVAAELEAARGALGRLQALAAELGVAVCGSGFGAVAGAALPANRLELCLASGPEPALIYDKVHLFTPTAEHESFSAGTSAPRTLTTPLGRLSGLICYDLRFPELTRVPFLGEAEVLCVPAQWPRPRAAHWRALLVGLAVANQCFVVAANRTGSERIGRRGLELEFPGNSLVADPHGRVLAEGAGENGLVSAELDLPLARELRAIVPVARDRRPELYAAW
jgi:predicted amidohydrolase